MTPCWLLFLLCSPLWHPDGVHGWGGLSTAPSESECRPYIEKALKELSPETSQEAVDTTGSEQTAPPSQSADQEGSIEETEQATTKESIEGETGDEAQAEGEGESTETGETQGTEEIAKEETTAESEEAPQADDPTESLESAETQAPGEETNSEESKETEEEKEEAVDEQSVEDGTESTEAGENVEATSTEGTDDAPTAEEQSAETPEESTTEDKSVEDEAKSGEENADEAIQSTEQEGHASHETEEITEDTKQDEASEEGASAEEVSAEETPEEPQETAEEFGENTEASGEALTPTDDQVSEESVEITGGEITDSTEATESSEATAGSTETTDSAEAVKSPEAAESTEATESAEAAESKEAVESKETAESTEATEEPKESAEETAETTETSIEEKTEASAEENAEVSAEETIEASAEETAQESAEEKPAEEAASTEEATEQDVSETTESSGEAAAAESAEASGEATAESAEETVVSSEKIDATPTTEGDKESGEETEGESTEESTEQEQTAEEGTAKESEPTVEDQLTLEFETPKVRRSRDHIGEILHLTGASAETELLLAKTVESTLKDLKKLYDSAIKPLEILFKYRDLSNRHFGDPEIFSKPLILFMGPWSGGKSTILNYLLDNEFKSSSLRTGAEPSPAYFNILMWGEREEVLDGTQLAADWTFSGLQKFGQGLLDRLRGLRLNAPLLEKVNIVEIPGILEIRKQVERLFPFNDACQWFIDRADIIFLVYDPSKLDVGPETEAILDQLKGREYQTRIILNKADQVKPEELMRVQGTLIWNISPLMSSQEPPVMYSTSLWSIPYEQGAPSRLLHAQERAFLRDLRQAVDKRVENKIASARRFAVRVRNHAKMVDCYLTTYYNHKSFFGNRKKVADDIIEHPQNYHIYEGLSTLTNISRYDLPDPEVYRDFFRLNPVYDFQRLSDTCTYFRGCPINRLDVAIAYDLPELVGKYKKQAEKVLDAANKESTNS